MLLVSIADKSVDMHLRLGATFLGLQRCEILMHLNHTEDAVVDVTSSSLTILKWLKVGFSVAAQA